MADVPAGKDADVGGFFRSVPARAWIAIALLALAIIVILQNRDPTRIQILMLSIVSPLWIMLALSVGAGVLIGLLFRRSRSRTKE